MYKGLVAALELHYFNDLYWNTWLITLASEINYFLFDVQQIFVT